MNTIPDRNATKKIKPLVWVDQATEYGKANGLVSLKCKTELGVYYHLANRLPGGMSTGKILFSINNGKIIECDTVEDAKELAQKDFEHRLLNFFENIPITSTPETEPLKELYRIVQFFANRGAFKLLNQMLDGFDSESSIGELRMLLVTTKPYRHEQGMAESMERIKNLLEDKIGKIS